MSEESFCRCCTTLICFVLSCNPLTFQDTTWNAFGRICIDSFELTIINIVVQVVPVGATQFCYVCGHACGSECVVRVWGGRRVRGGGSVCRGGRVCGCVGG